MCDGSTTLTVGGFVGEPAGEVAERGKLPDWPSFQSSNATVTARAQAIWWAGYVSFAAWVLYDNIRYSFSVSYQSLGFHLFPDMGANLLPSNTFLSSGGGGFPLYGPFFPSAATFHALPSLIFGQGQSILTNRDFSVKLQCS